MLRPSSACISARCPGRAAAPQRSRSKRSGPSRHAHLEQSHAVLLAAAGHGKQQAQRHRPLGRDLARQPQLLACCWRVRHCRRGYCRRTVCCCHCCTVCRRCRSTVCCCHRRLQGGGTPVHACCCCPCGLRGLLLRQRRPGLGRCRLLLLLCRSWLLGCLSLALRRRGRGWLLWSRLLRWHLAGSGRRPRWRRLWYRCAWCSSRRRCPACCRRGRRLLFPACLPADLHGCGAEQRVPVGRRRGRRVAAALPQQVCHAGGGPALAAPPPRPAGQVDAPVRRAAAAVGLQDVLAHCGPDEKGSQRDKRKGSRELGQRGPARRRLVPRA